MDNPQPTREQIELRAYELYLQRGAQPEQDLADWFAAEQELRAQQELIAQQESIEVAPPPAAQKAKRGNAASAVA